MKRKYNRIWIEDTEGNFSSKGVYDPSKEDVMVDKKKCGLTPKQKRLLKDKTELTKYSEKLGGFIHMYYIKNEILFNELNIDRASISRLIYLATYIDYNDRQENLLIKYGQHREIIPMSKRDIKDKMKLSDKTFNKFMNEMKNNNLIYECNKKFYINNDYFNKGENQLDEKEYTRVFIDTTRILYEQSSSRQHVQLSYIFQLIPYMNHELNIICENPEETDFTKIKKLSLYDICEKFDLSTSSESMRKFKRELLKFHIVDKDGKQALLSYVKVQNVYGIRDYFVINPKVVWRGNSMSEIKNTVNLFFFE